MVDELLCWHAAPIDTMAYWKQNIRKHYPDLLKNIDTTNSGLYGELAKLMSSSFPRRAISRIWVMICTWILFAY